MFTFSLCKMYTYFCRKCIKSEKLQRRKQKYYIIIKPKDNYYYYFEIFPFYLLAKLPAYMFIYTHACVHTV